MMRFNGESLLTIDVDKDGIDTMDSANAHRSKKFSEKVRRGEFIKKDKKA
jgi:hypothetical protein